MGVRRRSREAALKILYRADIRSGESVEGLAEEYFQDNPEDASLSEFTQTLVSGVLAHQPEIDNELSGALDKWDLARLGYMERAILRLSAFEIIHQPSTPDKVAIDEALELAKAYCDSGSSGLLNGALDHVMNHKTVAEK